MSSTAPVPTRLGRAVWTVCALGLLALPCAQAFQTTELAGLPMPTSDAAWAWTGDRLFLFGGATGGGTSDRITEVDPATGASTLRPERMPLSLQGASASWDGAYAYVVGGAQGNGAAGLSDAIVRFDPRHGRIDALLAIHLPQPLWHAAVVQAWGRTYVIGGARPGQDDSDEVVSFAPGSPPAVVGHLPRPLSEASAVWTGEAIYVLGGTSRSHVGNHTVTANSADILRAGPDGAWTREAALPAPLAARWSAVAFWDGRDVRLAGGQQAGLTTSDRVVAFNPDNRTSWVESGRLPYAVSGAMGAWAAGRGLLLGGTVEDKSTSRVLAVQAERPPSSPPSSGALRLTAAVDGMQAQASLAPPGPLASLAWDWGDGTVTPAPPNGTAASHAYARGGDYLVQARAVGPDGGLHVAEARVHASTHQRGAIVALVLLAAGLGAAWVVRARPK